MKRLAFLFLLFLAGTSVVSSAHAQDRDFDALAHQIVNTTAQVQPGEVVAISGGQHTLPLMEALAIEVQKAGGRPALLLTTDRIARSFWTEVDEQYLGQRDPADGEWLDLIDVYIGLPEVQDDAAVNEGVSEVRRAKRSAAYADFSSEINAAGVRDIMVGYPAEEDARRYGIDFATLERRHWAALNADFTQIARTAEALAAKLRVAKEVKVTAPSGTDFRFQVNDRPIFKSDGVTDPDATAYFDRTEYLPTGSVYFAPVETSATGRVNVPRVLCDETLMTNLSFSFENGIVKQFNAAEGKECFDEHLGPYDGPKDRFGWFAIGLNPAVEIMEENNANYRPDEAAGMVYIGIGRNTMYPGGQNATGGSFSFPITQATVTIDGEVVVRNGTLVGSLADAGQ